MLILTIGSVATFLAIESVAISQLFETLYEKKGHMMLRLFVWGLILSLELVGFVNP